MKKSWVEEEIDFYDFIWRTGTEICAFHVNEELMEDFRNGGDMFKKMVTKIADKYPTRESALKVMLDEKED